MPRKRASAPSLPLRCKDEVFSKGSGLDERREEKNTLPHSFVCVCCFPLTLAAERETKLKGTKESEKFVLCEKISAVGRDQWGLMAAVW